MVRTDDRNTESQRILHGKHASTLPPAVHSGVSRTKAHAGAHAVSQIAASQTETVQPACGKKSDGTQSPYSGKHADHSERAAASHPASDEPDSTASIAKSTALMTVATLGSRATGLIRTWVMAFVLGNTLITSAYQVANNMPNLIYELVAGGLLAAAFIPVFMLQKERHGDEEGNLFAVNVLNILIVVLGILSLLATVFAPQVIATQTFTVDSSADVTVNAVAFFRLFAIQILFYGIGGVVTGLLNANRVFFLPSLAPAINNVIVIVAFVLYAFISPGNATVALYVLGIGTSLGVVVQFCIQIPALKKQGFSWKPYINLRDPALVEALKIAVPTFVYVIGTMIAFSCRNAFSLQAGDNGPSTLLYAWTWYQLPYGVVAVSLSRAYFTEMSAAAAKEDWGLFRQHVKSGLSTTLLFIVPLAGLVGVFSQSIMQLFQVGAFDQNDVAYVAGILSLWVVSLPFYSVLMYLYNVFASIRKFLTFALVSCLMIIPQVGLYAFCCNPNVLGLAGVPLADFVYYLACSAILSLILSKRIGSFGLKSILWSFARVLAATAIGMLVGYGILFALSAFFPTGGIIGGLVELCCGGLAGLAVIFGLCALFRVPEMTAVKQLLGKVTARLKRS